MCYANYGALGDLHSIIVEDEFLFLVGNVLCWKSPLGVLCRVGSPPTHSTQQHSHKDFLSSSIRNVFCRLRTSLFVHCIHSLVWEGWKSRDEIIQQTKMSSDVFWYALSTGASFALGTPNKLATALGMDSNKSVSETYPVRPSCRLMANTIYK